MIDQAARARLECWKQSILDLSSENRLLDCTDCVAIQDVDPVELAGVLRRGGVFDVKSQLARALVPIRRAARTQSEDAGVHGLWLALGLLVWCDDVGQPHRAPLVLWPVELDGSRLVAAGAGAEPCLNHTLRVKLQRDFAIALADHSALDVAATLDSITEIVAIRPGWHLERGAWIGRFSLADVALWRDVSALDDEVLGASPMIARLANSATEPVLVVEAGTAAATLRTPLDADADQLRAIAAVAAGGPGLVVRGGPGTGKSQTIANLIVDCAGQGKSILVVSDTLAALETVQRRLVALGLGELCLELHSSKASRSVVTAQLARVLERAMRRFDGAASRPNVAPSADGKLEQLRTTLDGHAAMLHRVGVFGRSLHAVLGRLVELRTAPDAAWSETDAVGLDGATFELRKRAIERLADTAISVEPVACHPWRASTLASWRPDGRDRAAAAIDEAATAAAALASALGDVASLVPGLLARTPEQLQTVGALAALAAASPRPGGELLAHVVRDRGTEAIDEQVALIRARGNGAIEPPRDPHAFVALANRHRQLAAEVAAGFTDSVSELDAGALWTQLRKWKNSMAMVRFVALRNARAAVQSAKHPVARPGEPDAALLEELEAVIAERACRAALELATEPARRWFGELAGSSGGLELDKLEAALRWVANLRRAFEAVEIAGGDVGRTAAWRSLVAQVAANPGSEHGADLARFSALANAVARWFPALAELAEATGIDRAELGRGGGDHVGTVRDRAETLRLAIDGFRDWVMFHCARHEARAQGIGPAVSALDRGDLAAAEVASAWERATLLAWAEAEWRSVAGAPLGAFHGTAHHACAAAFAELDRATQALVRSQALARLAERRAAMFASAATPASEELALLIAELHDAAGKPLRALLASARGVLPCIAPCVLATPVAVAEYLDPSLTFDVVVIDDASRIATADALGALARGATVVVVGDSRRAVERTERASLLEDCLAVELPCVTLVGHYRGRNEDLIAFANRRYYDDRLRVVPAAHRPSESGVSWRRVPGDDDGTREAEAIVGELIARLRDPDRPPSRSIGIVALSRVQYDRIEDLLDVARSADPLLDAAFRRDVDERKEGSPRGLTEAVLVRHVDTWPGNARDVVLVSLGGDRDVSARDGERAIAVASTRAREQLVVFSSLAPEQLANDAAAAWLAFARDGHAEVVHGHPPASPITSAIATALGERGWTLHHQVGLGGSSGCAIDLGVVDPDHPERYVLAIEHDGAGYASATTARDRDRLRPQALAQLGWRLHRVWSLDWWSDPERELQRAHSAIVTAIAATRQRATLKARSSRPARPQAIAPHPTDAPVQAIDGTTVPTFATGSSPVRLPRNAIPIGPYMAAAIPPGRRTPDDLFATRHLAELGKVVEQVLAAEAPMHLDLLARRVGAYFGIGRVTPRVTAQVRCVLEGRGRWGAEADVVWRLDQNPDAMPAVRVAGNNPSGRREIEQVPLSELAAAARIVVERAAGISTNDLIRDAARLIGFARITEDVTDRVARGVQLAHVRELIRIDSGKATLVLD